MGVVHRAEDIKLHLFVALKFPPAGCAQEGKITTGGQTYGNF